MLCYDPIGQGERKQLIDPKTGKGLHSATGEHQVLGVGPLLVGRSLASYMIWDGMRCIDYLEQRTDVDPERIGCTGNSGGGNMTSYLMALDSRIAAAAPGCFITTTIRKNEKPGPGDPEQNIFGQLAMGVDHSDFLMLRAPRPTLVLAATHDFVPIEGTWEAYREAKRFYTILDASDRIGLAEAPAKHGYSSWLRNAAIQFFSRWFHEKGFEPELFENIPVEDEADLLVTELGQVMSLEEERSLFECNLEREEELRTWRASQREKHPDWSLQSQIDRALRLTGYFPWLEELPAAMLKKTEDPEKGSPFQQLYETEPGIRLPVLRFRNVAEEDVSRVHLVCVDEKWQKGKIPEAKVIPELGEGEELVLLNLRDSGFSKTRNWRFYGADAWIAYMIGDSYLGMRTRDLLAMIDQIHLQRPQAEVHLHADEAMATTALHAAYLRKDGVKGLRLEKEIVPWRDVLASRSPARHLHDVVEGGLSHYDLDEIAAALPFPVEVIEERKK